MSLTRRELLAGTAQLAAAGAFQSSESVLPAGRDFALPPGLTYLNSAFIHPMPIASAQAVNRYVEARTFSRERWSGDELAAKVRGQFAALINARPAEISLVESTSRGENLVVNGLGVPSNAGNVVTDALHFEGSLILYGELQKRGLDVRLVRPHDWRIDPADRGVAGLLVQRLSARFKAPLRSGPRSWRLRLRGHRPGGGQHAHRRACQRCRLLRLFDVQMADGRLRPRVPLRA
jgi:hypothetical protein